MEEKSWIQVPEGYEIDKEKSTFNNVFFKKKKEIKERGDLIEINGYYIDSLSNFQKVKDEYACDENRNIFATEKQAKSALAFAQITQLLPYYDGHTELRKGVRNYVIRYHPDTEQFGVNCWKHISVSQFYFSTFEFAEEFIKNNEDLLRQYFMLD